MSRTSTAVAAAAVVTMGLVPLVIRAVQKAPVVADPFEAVALSPEEVSFVQARAREETERWEREQMEQWIDAIDPGELAEHTHRIGQDRIDAQKARVEDVFLQGESIFDRRFTRAEGLGTGLRSRPAPALSRVENGADAGGPDAISCRECHGRGGDDGHGELHQRAWLDGDGRHLHSARPRTPPHVAGVGLVQALAAEMSRDLDDQMRGARAVAAQHPLAPVEMRLVAKGVTFGVVAALPDGTLDTRGVVGVDADLVVRPFGWKGTRATLRDFVRNALPQHIGLEPLPLGGPEPFATVEARPTFYDLDRDGVPGELTEGQLTSLAVYLALLDVPLVLAPRDPEAHAAWVRGAARFERIGCGSCHRALRLASVKWTERAPGHDPGFAIDLIGDNQVAPRLEQLDYSQPGFEVRLFSDLRRHEMGVALAERREGGASETEFLTRPLWGIGDRGPYYLHDGRARSLRDAILLHGGEAQPVTDAFRALPEADKRALVVFLLSLRRAPQGRIQP